MYNQTVASYTLKGLFNSEAIPLIALNASENVQTFDTEIGGGKDPVTLIIDIPSTGSGVHKLICIGTNGSEKEIPLTAAKLNITHITTHGLVDENGNAKFRYYTDNTDGIAMIGIKVSVIRHIQVVNN